MAVVCTNAPVHLQAKVFEERQETRSSLFANCSSSSVIAITAIAMESEGFG